MPLSNGRTRLGSDLEEKVGQFAHFSEDEEARREVADEFLQNHVEYSQEQYLDLGDIGLDADQDLRNTSISDHITEEDIEDLADLGPELAGQDFQTFQDRREELSQRTVNPDFEVLNYDNLREAAMQGDIVTHPRNPQVPVGRGDQAPKADLQRLVWEAAEEAAASMLEQEINGQPKSTHAAETKEQAVIGGEDSPPNAKHLGMINQYLVEGGDVEHYRVSEQPDNSEMIGSIETDRAAAAVMGMEGGFSFREDVEDLAVEFHEQLGSELDMDTTGDFNDVPMFELLLKSGVPPRYVNAPIGEDTVGAGRESEAGLEGTYTTQLMFSPEQSMEQGTLVYSAVYDGEVVTRTADEIIEGGAHTTAAQNYDVALPVLSVGDRLWFNNPVRGADKYQGALDIVDAIAEVTDGEYDSHPFIDMGFPAVDLESGYPVSAEMAEVMEDTPHGDKFGPFDVDMTSEGVGDWDADDVLYHRNASLMAPAVTPEFAEYFRDEIIPEVYDELGAEPEDPGDLEVDEFMTRAYELGAEAMATGEYKTESNQAGGRA
jgi:hypothetical protein